MLRRFSPRLCAAHHQNDHYTNNFFQKLRTRLMDRIPQTGHETTARYKWATHVYWYLLDPLLRCHHYYYRRKVVVDRFLERNSVFANTIFGILLGLTVYFLLAELVLPTAADDEHNKNKMMHPHNMEIYSPQDNAQIVVDCIGTSTTKELPAFQLMRLKRIIMGRVLEVADLSEVRRQREETEKLKALLAK
ncbi:hypothetical protein AGDE_00010 [Angomonas deanei]|nr:hypothetical protein AGDE_09925 [Angomonas deanei]EPY43910.1 hypothetical protein AGDE_00010 [Angomonas deanei]|eukprot:EPY29686.1 hypothetical protein AGDE_09925 [Angomonas deanei]